MKNVRWSWLTLPSGLVLGVNVLEPALSPEALRTEGGTPVGLLKLAADDRAAVWARYAQEREAVEEMLEARCNWKPAVSNE